MALNVSVSPALGGSLPVSPLWVVEKLVLAAARPSDGASWTACEGPG